MRLEGLKELIAQVAALGRLEQITAALKAGGAHIAGKLRQYPPQRRGPQPFKTDKQRRYFFYAKAKGLIGVPYQRGSSPGSRNLKQLWTVEAESATRVVVGNNTPYGPYVQDRDRQSRYHRETGWLTTQGVAASETPAVSEYVLLYAQQAISQGA